MKAMEPGEPYLARPTRPRMRGDPRAAALGAAILGITGFFGSSAQAAQRVDRYGG